MFGRIAAMAAVLGPALFSADLPIREVILYKHGVGFFERSGELKPGETARLDFKAEDMNDVLKSLTIADHGGGKVEGVRYDSSESLDKRLADFPFALGQQATLSAFLDQMKGAQLEITLGAETVSGTVAGARTFDTSNNGQAVRRETVTLLTGAGELRTVDLGTATSVKLTDSKLPDFAQGLSHRAQQCTVPGQAQRLHRFAGLGRARACRRLHDAIRGVEIELPHAVHLRGRTHAGRLGHRR